MSCGTLLLVGGTLISVTLKSMWDMYALDDVDSQRDQNNVKITTVAQKKFLEIKDPATVSEALQYVRTGVKFSELWVNNALGVVIGGTKALVSGAHAGWKAVQFTTNTAACISDTGQPIDCPLQNLGYDQSQIHELKFIGTIFAILTVAWFLTSRSSEEETNKVNRANELQKILS